MAYQCLQSRVEERVATIALDRPAALNAITPELLVELRDAVRAASEDPAVGVIVLTGQGRAFSAGVDLKALGDRALRGGMVGDVLDVPARAAIEAITRSDKPVVAKVNGACFTGALELALACDLMVVAQEAKLGDTHAKWGLRPTWGMTARLPLAVGLTRARELSMTARTFRGDEAVAMGMACASVPVAELDAAVAQLCATLLANSADSLAVYKRSYATPELHAALAREAEASFAFDDADTERRLAAFRK